nr:unnamed protein product [Digitaria exilis]
MEQLAFPEWERDCVCVAGMSKRKASTHHPLHGSTTPSGSSKLPTPATLLKGSRLATAPPPIDQARPPERPPPRAADRARKRSDQEARLARGKDRSGARGVAVSFISTGRPAS